MERKMLGERRERISLFLITSHGVDCGGDGKRILLNMLTERELSLACSQGTISNLVRPICKNSWNCLFLNSSKL